MGWFPRLIIIFIENNTNNDQVAVFEHYCHDQNNNVNNCCNYNKQKMHHKMSCNRLDVVSKLLAITISLCFVYCYCYLMCLSCTNMTIIIITIHINPLHTPYSYIIPHVAQQKQHLFYTLWFHINLFLLDTSLNTLVITPISSKNSIVVNTTYS